jgi:hypothetical protein
MSMAESFSEVGEKTAIVEEIRVVKINTRILQPG